jgi:hypothetical protein
MPLAGHAGCAPDAPALPMLLMLVLLLRSWMPRLRPTVHTQPRFGA